MRRPKKNPKKLAPKQSVSTLKATEPPVRLLEDARPPPSSTETSPGPSRASTPSSKTSFVRPSLALTKLQQENEANEAHEVGADEYSPHDPYYTNTAPHPDQYVHDPGVEPADPQVIATWEENLRRRLEQAYPRMCYYFLCDKSLFVLVTLLTLRRIAKADMLNGRPVGSGRRDRQFVDDIAQCMSDAELRYDKDEEWMTWWRETLLTVQGGLQRGWIHADSPNIVYAKQIMQLYRRIARIAKRLAEAES